LNIGREVSMQIRHVYDTRRLRLGSWLCKNTQTRNGDRMDILRNRIPVRKDSSAHSAKRVWRKTILVAFQFFAFLHSLGQTRPRLPGFRVARCLLFLQ
jgi:hypothetical protein